MESMIADMAGRVFSDHVTHATRSKMAQGEWPTTLWAEIEQSGLPLALVSESAGGFGVAADDALGIMRIAGAHGVPVPLGETMLANWLLAQAGLPLVAGPHSVTDGSGLTLIAKGDGWSVSGQLDAVPWGRNVARIVTMVTHQGANMVVTLPAEGLEFQTAYNMAGEPRDGAQVALSLQADQVAQVDLPSDTLVLMGALMRSLSMAGALETVMTLCVGYAGERVQFGRPISKFQAIQHYIASMAGEVAASRSAADMVAAAFDGPAGHGPVPHLVAAAKLRTGEASQNVAALAHQIHGAIGFTEEHSLHHFTKRLWAWRDEFGTERDWAQTLGKAALAGSSDSFWEFVTGTAPKGVAS